MIQVSSVVIACSSNLFVSSQRFSSRSPQAYSQMAWISLSMPSPNSRFRNSMSSGSVISANCCDASLSSLAKCSHAYKSSGVRMASSGGICCPSYWKSKVSSSGSGQSSIVTGGLRRGGSGKVIPAKSSGVGRSPLISSSRAGSCGSPASGGGVLLRRSFDA